MPHPNLYEGTQDDDRTRSVDLVHIEPSIREGLFLVSSLYGPGASAPITRFPPVFTIQPYITGPAQIPGVLVMNLGQAPASPAAQLQVQWMRDGVDIPGATGLTLPTNSSMDGWVVTAEVRAINPFGEDIAMTSNSVTLSLIEPIEVQDYDIHAITGLTLPNFIFNRDERTLVVTGRAADTRLDINRNEYYLTQGHAAPTREDINTMLFGMVTGLPIQDTIMIHNMPEIGVINYEDQQTLVEGLSVPLNLKNGDAEAGYAGWVIDGTAIFVDAIPSHQYQGSYYFRGGTSAYTRVTQDVELFAPWNSDIDAGTTFVEWSWYQSSAVQTDTANVKLEFLDINKTVISTIDPQGLWAGPNAARWLQILHEAPIPANTRFIKFVMEFARISADSNSDGRIDVISASIRKGAKPNFLDFTGDGTSWRVRFTQARTYPGCSLSELEFRATPGGADLATGGTPIFGSEGNGGAASFAFDDLRNTGYWAGEQTAVSKNTAWIGYNFPSPVRPREVDITLRPDNFALELGREMYIEASNDQVRWFPIQVYRNIPDPQVVPFQQQRQFAVPQLGPVGYKSALIVSPQYVRNTFSVDNYATKGMVLRMKTRMAIDRMRFYRIGSTLPWQANIRIGRAQFNTRWLVGTVHDVQVRDYNNTNWGWEEVTFASPFNVNVNDYIYIMVTDLQASAIPGDANEGRVAYLNNQNDKVLTTGESWMDNDFCTRWSGLSRWSDLNITQGDEDETSTWYDYGIDFAGNII